MTVETAPASKEQLLERFRPLFDRIAEGAVRREAGRVLPFEEVARLRDAGFTAVTVPVEYGGSGASVRDLFTLLIALGEADSNLPQLLRAHFAFVEGLLLETDRADRVDWFRRIAGGDVVGNASHERGTARVGSLATRLTPAGDGWVLDGEKFYSTGSLFADWILTSAETPDGERVSVTVPARAEGVTRHDDWLGFGQRLTGTGTTSFAGVRIPAGLVHRREPARRTPQPAFLQTVLLSTLSGIAAAAVRDATRFVRDRTRVYSQGVGETAAEDPLVQSVVGRLSANAAAARTLTLGAAEGIERAHEAIVTGSERAEDLIEAAELGAVQAQLVVVELVLRGTTGLFDVGGASATSTTRALDRHWRNARTVSSHNPVVYQERAIGDHLVNGADLTYFWATGETRQG